jgi:glycosyltransferase involved in cell wall biosynthesis
MQPKEIYFVVPFSRPQFLQSVLDNFRRQTFKNKRLVIVENGPAVGTCKAQGVEPDILLTSSPGVAFARNEGLAEARRRGGEYIAYTDDDDYYGPKYLEEIAQHAKPGRVVGKAAVYYQMTDGRMRFFSHGGELRKVHFIQGPTMSAWVSDAADFDNTATCGEDSIWEGAMRNKGCEIFATSRFNALLRRYINPNHHTWYITDRQMIQFLPGLAYDVGEPDLDVVNGLKPEPYREWIPKKPCKPWHQPSWVNSIRRVPR